MGDSKFGLKSIDLVEIGRKMKKSSKMDITSSRYEHFQFSILYKFAIGQIQIQIQILFDFEEQIQIQIIFL